MGVLLELSATLITALELSVVGSPLLHQFDAPGGVTGLYLLSESHLAWHTYPESELCTINLYCCRSRPMLDWSVLLRRALGAERVALTVVQRGLAPEPGPAAGTPP
jgi:S-adenosylmethionine decarboxylase